MIELLIMRHAKSDWKTGELDINRPLNGRGAEAAVRMARWVLANELIPDRVVSSAAARTHQTMMAIVDTCNIESSVVDFDSELYLASANTWLQVIRAQSCQRLLICGHNPGLDVLVDFLSATDPQLTPSGKLMTTAAIAHLRFDTGWQELAEGSGELVQLVRPRELTPQRD